MTSSTSPLLLLVPAQASAFACVTDKTARGGDTELQLLDVDGGGLQLQGSLGALEVGQSAVRAESHVVSVSCPRFRRVALMPYDT